MIKNRKSKGQSTTEFALMMPVIMVFFFWIFQVNIYFSAMNQGAWAAYAAARTHLVLGGPDDGGVTTQKTVDRILTGKLFQENGRNPTVEEGESTIYGGGGAEGVILKLKSLETLPYVSSADNPLLKFEDGFEISTHLGWQEYDTMKYPKSDEWETTGPDRTGRKMQTDNNLTDYD